MKKLKVIIGMECSQAIQRAFEKRGHHAYSIDFKAAPNMKRHYQGDVFKVLASLDYIPDLVILHPVCRYISVSGMHWVGKPGHEDRAAKVEKGVKDFLRCTRVKARARCIENPRGIMGSRYRAKDQTVQPYEFGDDASKTTDLWLSNLPLLVPTSYIKPRMVASCNCRSICGKQHKLLPRWANQTDSGQNKLGPTKDPEDRRAARAVTYSGIAEAMAEQWSAYLTR